MEQFRISFLIIHHLCSAKDSTTEIKFIHNVCHRDVDGIYQEAGHTVSQ